MKCGIYLIINKVDNKVYVGQSVNVKSRINVHKRHLKSGRHANDYLQKAFNKHGENNFEFTIIEYCDFKVLDEKEKFWIGHYKSLERDLGYNLESGGHCGKYLSEDARERKRGAGNPMFGKKLSHSQVELLRIKNRANSKKLTEENVVDIKVKLYNGITQNSLSKEYNVTISTINKIARCKNWSWVKEELNEFIMQIEVNKKNHIKNIKSKRIEKRKNFLETKMCVLEDFKKGISRDEILKKYNVSKTTYTRIVSEEYNKQKSDLIKSVIQLKSEGYMVKEIAEKLKLHRTTVTEYIKKHTLSHANTEGA